MCEKALQDVSFRILVHLIAGIGFDWESQSNISNCSCSFMMPQNFLGLFVNIERNVTLKKTSLSLLLALFLF